MRTISNSNLRTLRWLACASVLFSSTLAIPSDDVVRFNRFTEAAQIARESGELRLALQATREAYAIQPLPVLMNNIGKLHEELGEYDLAFHAYSQVTNDPNAPTDLRILDQARIAALESKISRAWVRVNGAGRWTDVRAHHTFCPPDGTAEVAIETGRDWLGVELNQDYIDLAHKRLYAVQQPLFVP